MPCFVKTHHPFLHQHIVPPRIATSGDVRWVDGWERLCQMCLFDQDQTKKQCEAIKGHSLLQNPPMSSFMNVNRATCGKLTPLTTTKCSCHHDEPHMNGIPNPICHPPNMWVT
jgi:hypothetical protein